ncbi:MAG: hypothetical protein HGA45_22935 [Chloroflexales bacterium]|nr:hypothetical protein [Chloroflexales bacterium]
MREEEVVALVARRLPPDLAAHPPVVRLYPDEVVVVLQVDPADEGEPEEPLALIARRREETRPSRMRIARELERVIGLPVAWGMRSGAAEALFTTRTTPVMTRLGRAEREVLDTLVAAGVADTRSGALAYAVRAFAAEHAEWLAEVRQAIAEVERVRARLRHRSRKGPPPTNGESE